MLFNEEYRDITDEETKARFWMELRVNHAKIQDEISNKNYELAELLEKFPFSDLEDICTLLKIQNEKETKSKEILKSIMEQQDSEILLYLSELLKKRKRYIDEYYSYKCYGEKNNYIESSAIVKLLHLYLLNHTFLIELIALAEWKMKASGVEYCLKKEYPKDMVQDMLLEDKQIKLCSYLQENAKNKNQYKITMYCEYADKQNIFLIYKMKNDQPYTDFDESKRVKSITPIMFMIDLETHILKIKSNTQQEYDNIKMYLQKEYNCELEAVQQNILDDYDVDKFKKAFASLDVLNQDVLVNFYISKIAFSKSLLSKSPEIIIGEGKRDIWAGVVHAYAMRIIDIDSLYSIKNINLCVGNIKKIVRTILLQDGCIIFKLDDKGIEPDFIDLINKKFEAMFGVPLNTKLKNKLERGTANDVDIILRTDTEEKIEYKMRYILKSLKEDKLITTCEFKKAICMNQDCRIDIEISETEVIECPECGGDEIKYEKDSKITVNRKKVSEYVLKCLENTLGLSKSAFIPTADKRLGKNLEMYRFAYKENEYRVIIIDKLISGSKIEMVEKQLVPTIIIYYGIDNQQAKLMTPNTVQFLQFGLLYGNKEDIARQKEIVDRTIKELDNNINHHIVSAAAAANRSLRNMIQEQESLDEERYCSDDFEDDVYAILKHLIFRTNKWGATERGKPLPEGVIAFDYKYKQGQKELENKRAFIFDCKLNYDGKGYDLGIGEKRKAINYVNRTNKSSQIELFCTDNQLSSHILISNKFKESQLKEMNNHFKGNIVEGFSTRGIFIKIEGLLTLYDWFRKNYDNVQKYRDVFYKNLYQMFIIDDEIIEEKHWDRLIENMNECFKYSIHMNASKVHDDLIK